MAVATERCFLTPEEVAEILGVSRKTVYRRWSRWGLHAYFVGPLLRFLDRDVDELIERMGNEYDR